jgi:subtilisin family serine protease
MRRPHTLPVLLAALAVSAACTDDTLLDPPASPTETEAPMAGALTANFDAPPARHMVVFKGKTPKNFAATVAAAGGSVVFVSDAVGIAGVQGLDAAGAASLAALSGVDMVESEPMLPMAEPVSFESPLAVDATPASPGNPAGAARFPRQWNLRAIKADVAWAAGRLGSPAVTVAILDTGIGYMHPDLAGRVDLSRSASFEPSDDAYVAFYFPGAHPITDIGYHGTHVAATVSSNALAAAGVTSGVTLIGAKVCSVSLGGCPGVAVTQGILHAIENGADVANMSLGGGFDKSTYPGYVSVLNRLFNYAKQRNVTFVVAAGNESLDLDHASNLFKTYCDAVHVICVSATGPTSGGTVGPWTDVDAPADYTNYGRSAIDVAAPGGTGGGAVWAACSPTSLVYTVCQTGTFILGLGGTSMATPHVAGLAALAVEDVGRDAAKVRAYIRNSADAIGGGNTPFYGKGRINVAAATGTN